MRPPQKFTPGLIVHLNFDGQVLGEWKVVPKGVELCQGR